MRFGFRRKQAPGGRVWLGAFGKHPAWDDHFDSPGLDTARLTQLRSTLYSEGIGGRIDAGVWDKLGPEERLDGFAHTLVWRTADGLVVARLLDSVDGKGRSRYPLVVSAHAQGVSGAWVCNTLTERLARVADACAAHTTRDELFREIELARDEWRSEISLLDEPTRIASGDGAPGALAACAGEEAIDRVLYQCRRDMRGFLKGTLRGERSASRTIDVSAKQCRGPGCAPTPGGACELWLRTIDHLIGDTVPVMVIVPDSLRFVDIVVGEPEARQFYCLLASPAALPLASEVPFEVDEQTRAWARELMVSSRDGSLADRDPGWVSVNGRR